jgi:hypothetical protein
MLSRESCLSPHSWLQTASHHQRLLFSYRAVATTTVIFLVAGIALIGLFEKPLFEPARVEVSDVEVFVSSQHLDFWLKTNSSIV